MNVVILVIILVCCLTFLIPAASNGVILSLLLILAVIGVIVIAKRNFDLKKHNLSKYDEDELIIQNVRKGGVIRLTNVDGQDEPLDLKVVDRNLYMEGDYSWYELECMDAKGEKYWVEVDDDDELVVSIVVDKPQNAEFSSSLDDIDENEAGQVKYKGRQYRYSDSGKAVFFKHCDSKHKESLYYYDFVSGDHIFTAEKWNETERPLYFVSQIINSYNITVYSTKGGNNKDE